MPEPTTTAPRLVLTTVPAGLAAALRNLQAPCYLHRTPAWKLRAFLGVALLPTMAGLVYVLRQAALGRAGVADWAMGAFLLIFAVVLLRPSTWQPQVSLAADVRGLYFLGSDPHGSSVFVPWAEVGEMTIGHESTGQEGRARSVILRIADDSSLWAPAKASTFMRHFIGTPDAAGRRGVPIGNAGLRPEDTLEALRAIRGLAR